MSLTDSFTTKGLRVLNISLFQVACLIPAKGLDVLNVPMTNCFCSSRRGLVFEKPECKFPCMHSTSHMVICIEASGYKDTLFFVLETNAKDRVLGFEPQ